MTDHYDATDFIALTGGIVAAYVSHNAVQASDLPKLISDIYCALNAHTKPEAPPAQPLAPPVPIKKTVTPDYIISLEDGKRYKSLRPHLTSRGLTAEAYREKWGLAHDYPMVCSAYAAERSALAKSIGLGQKRKLRAVA